MKKFEYLIRNGDIFDRIEDLTYLGLRGWEIVGYYEGRDTVLFKRELCETDVYVVEAADPLPHPFLFLSDTYADKYVSIEYTGVSSGHHLHFGNGFRFEFRIENKTDFTLTINAKSLTANEKLLVHTEQMLRDLGAHESAEGTIYLFFERDSLVNYGINSVYDIHHISFMLEIIDNENDESYYSPEKLTVAQDENLPF